MHPFYKPFSLLKKLTITHLCGQGITVVVGGGQQESIVEADGHQSHQSEDEEERAVGHLLDSG